MGNIRNKKLKPTKKETFTPERKCAKQCALCRNPSLELTTKARACKVASQEGSPRVTSHVPGSEKSTKSVRE